MGIRIQGDGKDIKFGIMDIPHRKNKALYVMKGNVVEILAYFKSDAKAKQFDKIIDLLLEAWRGGEYEKLHS